MAEGATPLGFGWRPRGPPELLPGGRKPSEGVPPLAVAASARGSALGGAHIDDLELLVKTASNQDGSVAGAGLPGSRSPPGASPQQLEARRGRLAARKAKLDSQLAELEELDQGLAQLGASVPDGQGNSGRSASWSHSPDALEAARRLSPERAPPRTPKSAKKKPSRRSGTDKWYYASDALTRNREGPITKAAIDALVGQGKLQRRQAIVWRKGMKEWITIAESETATPERSSAARVEAFASLSLSSAVSPRTRSPEHVEDHVQAQLERCAVEKQLAEAEEIAQQERLARERLPALSDDGLENARARSPSKTQRSNWTVSGAAAAPKTKQDKEQQAKEAKLAEDLALIEQQLAEAEVASLEEELSHHIAADPNPEADGLEYARNSPPPEMEHGGGDKLDPKLEASAVKIQARVRGSQSRRVPELPDSTDDEDEDEDTAAAMLIQARIRGRQDRCRAAAKRLVDSQNDADSASDTSNRLNMDAAEWLTAQNEATIIADVKDEFGAQTLRDLVALIQDPVDWAMFIQDEPARCDALWKAMQEELAKATTRKRLQKDANALAAKKQQEQEQEPVAAAAVTALRLSVPAGKSPGETMQVPLPGGHVVAFEIPDGLQPGGQFEAELPTEVAVQIDTDSDGVITEEELKAWMAKLAAEKAAPQPEPEPEPEPTPKRSVRTALHAASAFTPVDRTTSGAPAIIETYKMPDLKLELLTPKSTATATAAPKLADDPNAPKPKQLTRMQVRVMVRIQLEIEQRDPNVTDQWIDSLFDRFDADGSHNIDDDEWDKLVAAIPTHKIPTLDPTEQIKEKLAALQLQMQAADIALLEHRLSKVHIGHVTGDSLELARMKSPLPPAKVTRNVVPNHQPVAQPGRKPSLLGWDELQPESIEADELAQTKLERWALEKQLAEADIAALDEELDILRMPAQDRETHDSLEEASKITTPKSAVKAVNAVRRMAAPMRSPLLAAPTQKPVAGTHAPAMDISSAAVAPSVLSNDSAYSYAFRRESSLMATHLDSQPVTSEPDFSKRRIMFTIPDMPKPSLRVTDPLHADWLFELNATEASIIGRETKKASTHAECMLPGSSMDKALSRKHTQVEYSEAAGGFTVACIGVNVVEVNSQRLDASAGPVLLSDGDRMTVGASEILVSLPSSESVVVMGSPRIQAEMTEEQAAMSIQARIRGRQDRRRAAARRLVQSQEAETADGPSSRLNVDTAEWLAAQNEAGIIDDLKGEFGCQTLRGVIAVIQDPADWGMFINDTARCNALWRALQKEVVAAMPQPRKVPPAVASPAPEPESVVSLTPKPKQLTRQQVRVMVRINLELQRRDPNVSDVWIDTLFDKFDADGSQTIDDAEWDNLLAAIPTHQPKDQIQAELEAINKVLAQSEVEALEDHMQQVRVMNMSPRQQAALEGYMVLESAIRAIQSPNFEISNPPAEPEPDPSELTKRLATMSEKLATPVAVHAVAPEPAGENAQQTVQTLAMQGAVAVTGIPLELNDEMEALALAAEEEEAEIKSWSVRLEAKVAAKEVKESELISSAIAAPVAVDALDVAATLATKKAALAAARRKVSVLSPVTLTPAAQEAAHVIAQSNTRARKEPEPEPEPRPGLVQPAWEPAAEPVEAEATVGSPDFNRAGESPAPAPVSMPMPFRSSAMDLVLQRHPSAAAAGEALERHSSLAAKIDQAVTKETPEAAAVGAAEDAAAAKLVEEAAGAAEEAAAAEQAGVDRLAVEKVKQGRIAAEAESAHDGRGNNDDEWDLTGTDAMSRVHGPTPTSSADSGMAAFVANVEQKSAPRGAANHQTDELTYTTTLATELTRNEEQRQLSRASSTSPSAAELRQKCEADTLMRERSSAIEAQLAGELVAAEQETAAAAKAKEDEAAAAAQADADVEVARIAAEQAAVALAATEAEASVKAAAEAAAAAEAEAAEAADAAGRDFEGSLDMYLASGKKKHARYFWLEGTKLCWDTKRKETGKANKSEQLIAVEAAPAIKSAREWFQQIDANKSGQIDAHELAELYKQARGEKLKSKVVSKAMADMGSNGSGKCDLKEFERWWSANGTHGPILSILLGAMSDIFARFELIHSVLFAGGDLEKHRDCALTVTCGGVSRGETVLLLVAPDAATHRRWVAALSARV